MRMRASQALAAQQPAEDISVKDEPTEAKPQVRPHAFHYILIQQPCFAVIGCTCNQWCTQRRSKGRCKWCAASVHANMRNYEDTCSSSGSIICLDLILDLIRAAGAP